MTSFAQRFRQGERLLGILLRMPNDALVELAGISGLDFVLLDTEHGPGDQLSLAHHLTAAQARGIAMIVRVAGPGEVLRALDLGAQGVLAPHVSSVEQAQAYVDAAHYPPLGRRGFAAYTRAGNFGTGTAVAHHEAARSTLVIPMIEDEAGLVAAADIAALDGIDGLMLGPADYACELGILGAPDDPRIDAARHAVRERAVAAGGAAVAIVGSVAAAQRAFGAGDTVVMYNGQQVLNDVFAGLAAPVASGSSAGDPTVSPEPLVLLPGMLEDGRVWDAVAPALHDLAAPRFARIDLDDSIGEMAESVLATAPERFALAGHSLGAIVALEIARRAPHRVTRLALVNASGRDPVAEQQSAWGALLDRLDAGEFASVADELAHSIVPAHRRDDADLLATTRRMAAAIGPDGLRRQLRAQQSRTSYLDGLAALTVPVLVVSGARDQVCPPERQHELVAHCPGASLVTLDDAGHLAPLEDPDAVAEALRHWLAE